jgi:hypothetical protein
MTQAGCYSGALHYLKAVADIGAAQAKADSAAVVTRTKAMPTDDHCLGKNTIRADGKAMIPAYLFEVKSPLGGESCGRPGAAAGRHGNGRTDRPVRANADCSLQMPEVHFHP